MNALFILGLILYVVFAILGRSRQKQQKEAQREASRNVAARGAEQKPATAPAAQRPVAQPMRQQPVQTTLKPRVAVSPPAPAAAAPVSMEGVGIPPIGTSTEGMDPSAPGARMRTDIASRLSQIRETTRHTLESSSITGHSHEETSISGVQPNCPSDAARSPAQSTVPRSTAPIPARNPALFWDASSVRAGILYAEILGKPKALRRR